MEQHEPEFVEVERRDRAAPTMKEKICKEFGFTVGLRESALAKGGKKK